VAVPCSPPAAYLQDVPVPVLRGRTNRYLAEYALELKAAVELSNADKRGLREWSKKGEKP
jgi:hypothetical protein